CALPIWSWAGTSRTAGSNRADDDISDTPPVGFHGCPDPAAGLFQPGFPALTPALDPHHRPKAVEPGGQCRHAPRRVRRAACSTPPPRNRQHDRPTAVLSLRRPEPARERVT